MPVKPQRQLQPPLAGSSTDFHSPQERSISIAWGIGASFLTRFFRYAGSNELDAEEHAAVERNVSLQCGACGANFRYVGYHALASLHRCNFSDSWNDVPTS